jgi:MerR family transcriptional regulator, light-induced transcriptional regulator
MDRLPQNDVTAGISERDCWTEVPAAFTDPAIWGRSAPASAHGALDEQRAQLALTIETEVIPRLMLAHQQPAALARHADRPAAIDPGTTVEFARIVLTNDFSVIATYVEALRASGITLETLCLDLLAPTARQLGEMWEADLCDFTDVTLGLWRLQQVMREFMETNPGDGESRLRGLRALLVPAPGEQHTFGLAMVMEFFRRAGWDVCAGPGATVGELRAMVSDDWFDVVGISVGVGSRLDLVASCIRAIRKSSRNPHVGVIVGGRAFNDHAERIVEIGADALVTDGPHAPLHAEHLLARLARDRRAEARGSSATP